MKLVFEFSSLIDNLASTLQKIMQISADFVTKKDTSCDTLHIYLNPIHLKYTHISKLPDFVGVQQLHSSCAF